MAVEENREAKAIMQNAQKEEFKHFAMDVEFLLRRKREWRDIMQRVLFTSGDVVQKAEKAEEQVD